MPQRLLITFLLSLALTAGEVPKALPVPGWVAPAAGEHPRLLLRKADVPALKARAETPEGKAIVARLREVLGGGETMPTRFNPAKTANTLTTEPNFDVQTWTVSHGAGFAMLWLLTGERRYADLARTCVERVVAGTPDRDLRYNWRGPGTGFRLGVVWMAVALAYDLAYDGWDETFRRQVVAEFHNAKERSLTGNGALELTLEAVAGGVKYPAGSNHFGAALPGAGFAALAMRGDPGADDARLGKVLESLDRSLIELLTKGFGDHGWFAEGLHTGRIASQSGAAMLLPALRNAAGQDWAAGCTHARYLSLRVLHELITLGGVPTVPSRGPYGDNIFWARSGIISHTGEFAIGFGALATRPDERAAMHAVWKTSVEPYLGAKLKNPWDTWIYPHHAVWSLVFWPIGETPKDPGTVLPHAIVDTTHGYYVFRNHWRDDQDVIVTALLGYGPKGYHKCPGGPVMVIADGKVQGFGTLAGTSADAYSTKPDGSSVLSAKGTSLAVDFSGTAGCTALLVMHGPGAKGGTMVGPFAVLTAPAAKAKEATVVDGKLILGGQTVSVVDGTLQLAK